MAAVTLAIVSAFISVTSPTTPPHRRTEWLNKIQQLKLLWFCGCVPWISLSPFLSLCLLPGARVCVCYSQMAPAGLTVWVILLGCTCKEKQEEGLCHLNSCCHEWRHPYFTTINSVKKWTIFTLRRSQRSKWWRPSWWRVLLNCVLMWL